MGLSPRAATIVGLALVAACGQRAPLLPSDDAVRACMTGSACGTTDFFGECISELVTIGRDPQELALSRHLSAAQASCLAAAGTDCNAARACLDLGVAATPCTSTASRCDGDVVRYCNERVAPGYSAAFDCSSVGLRCLVDSFGVADCAYGPCGAPTLICDGASASYCANHVIRLRYDCSAYDATCGTDSSSGAQGCIGAAASCPTMRSSCDGDSAVTCAGNREQRIDCAAQGLRCVSDKNGARCGNDTKCSVDTFSQTCADGVITYCFDGMLLTADCRAHGFSGCTETGCTL